MTQYNMVFGSKVRKEYVKAVYCHPAYLTYKWVEYIMWNAWLDEAQAGIKTAGRNINILRYADDTTLMAESEEERKSLLRVKEDWKIWLETQHSKNKGHGIQSHHFMANGWGKSGNSYRFYFLGSKITAESECSHKIKRCLLLRRKALTKPVQLVQSLSCVWLFATPWTATRQDSLSITNSRSWLKLMSIESVMPSDHPILWCPLLLSSVFPSIRVFSNESALHIRWPK